MCFIATSVDVERAFSQGTLTVSKYRHSLSDNATRASIVLSAWSKLPGVLLADEVIKMFERKSFRPSKVL